MSFNPFVATVGNQPTPLPVSAGGTGLTTSPITIALGGTGQTTDPLPPGQASDMGLLAWNYDIACCSGSTAPTTNVVNLMRVNIHTAMSVTNVIMSIVGGGTSLTSGQNFIGLYNSSGTQIGTSADQTTPWASGGVKAAALIGGPFPLSAGTFVWVLFCSNTTGTTPGFFRGGATSAAGLNLGASVSTGRFVTNGTATTSLPPSITPASNVNGGTSFWCGLS